MNKHWEHTNYKKLKERVFELGRRLDEAEATADKQKEMLEQYHAYFHYCPVCTGVLNFTRSEGHKDDCELAKGLNEGP